MLMSPLHPGMIPTGTVMGMHTRSSGHESAALGVQSVPHVICAAANGASARVAVTVVFPKKCILSGWVYGGKRDVLLMLTR